VIKHGQNNQQKYQITKQNLIKMSFTDGLAKLSLIPVITNFWCDIWTENEDDSNKRYAEDPFAESLFLAGFPIIISIVILILGLQVTKDLVDLLVPSIAILFGFTINVIVLMVSNRDTSEYIDVEEQEGKEEEEDGQDWDKKRKFYLQKLESDAIKQIKQTTLYAIVVGFFLLIVLILTSISAGINDMPNGFATVGSLIVYTILFHYLAILMYNVRQIYIAIDTEAIS